MPHTQAKPPILDSEFLGIRAKLIELAATLDRIDRAHGAAAGDARIEKIRRSLGVLAGEASDRTRQIQMIFSLPYEENWQQDS
jgi:hypothetical protein